MQIDPIKRHILTIHGQSITAFSQGEGDRVLLLVHGGPGCPSDYLRPSHFPLAYEGYRVVTWDQLGCGESDAPTDDRLWQIERFVDEMRCVCNALDITRCHILGQSWGGVLALEFALLHPEYVQSLIATGTAFDLPAMQRGFERKKSALGEETCTMMARHEAAGSTAHPEYQAAITLLMYRHLCRTDEWPVELVESMRKLAAPVFSTMFGPFFFQCTGNLRSHQRMDRLSEIKVPVLLLHGEHDYILPELASRARVAFPCAKLHLLRECSHLPFLEKPQAYFDALRSFLHQVESGEVHPISGK